MKWDVKVVDLGMIASAATHELELRALTSEGWQLVCVTNFGPSARAYLVKPLG